MNYQGKNKEELIKELGSLQNLYNELKIQSEERIAGLLEKIQTISEQEQKLRKLADNITDIIWEVDFGLNYTYISSSIRLITGFLPDEVTGKKLFDFIHSDESAEIETQINSELENYRQTGKIISKTYDYRQVCKDGRFFWAETISNPLFDNDNKLIGFQGVTRNITDWKFANHDLLSSKERLSKVFNAAPYVISIIRLSDKRTIDINQYIEEATGYAPDEIIGMMPNSGLLNISDEDTSRLFLELSNKSKLRNFEFSFTKKNGETGIALASSEFITIEGEDCAILFFEIVTQRKKIEDLLEESRERFKTLSEASFDAIFISENGICFEQNQTAEKMFGYTLSEAIGRYGTEWIVPEDREMVMNNMLQGYEKPYRITALRKDGSTFPAIIRARMMNYKGRNVRVTSLSDISQQKIIEQKLIESEKQFRLIFENNSFAIFWAEAETGIIIKCNKAAELLVERSQDEIIGKHHSILHPPENFQKIIKEFNEHILNKGNLPLESEVITKSGKIKLVEVNSTIIDFEGKVINQGVFKDISDKKKIDLTMRSLVMPTKEGDMNSIFANIVFNLTKILEFKFAFIGQISGNDKETIETIAFCKEQNILENFSYHLEGAPCSKVIENGKYICKKDAKLIFPNDLGLKMLGIDSYFGLRLDDSNGQAMGVIVVMDDKEMPELNETESILKMFAYKAAIELERKQSEDDLLDSWANLLAIVENTSDNVWAIDRDYNLVFINAKFEREFKLAYGVNLLPGMNIIENLPEPLVATWKAYYDRALANERFIFEEHFVFDKYDIFTEIAMNPIVTQGKIIGVSVFARDITERKHAELILMEKNKEIAAQNMQYLKLNEDLRSSNEELIKAKEKAEESDRLKTSFLQNMSHEIRTPMNAIMGFSSLLVNQYNNKQKLEQYSEIINNRCRDLLEIINDILDIAKIESGQLALNNEECDLNILNRELTAFFTEHQKRIGKTNILFNLIDLDDENDNLVITDKGKLKQIFINLIGNAFKFTDFGKIEGGCRRDGKNLLFYLSDTGIGIPDDKKDFIFERFSQLNQIHNKFYGGTGLGLSIVKGLVGLLEGKIWVESEPNKGSTFYFTIPYKPARAVAPIDQFNANANESNFDGIRLLIVEDDQFNAEYLKEILSMAGFELIHTIYGREAVKIATEQDIKIILMDIRLPDLVGYEATRQIKAIKPEIIIIAQTAYAATEDKIKAMDAGCDDYISKPVKREHLLKLVAKHLIE